MNFKNNSKLKELFKTEIQIMQKINHPNVLHLYDLLESGNNYYLIVDYCDKGDLENMIQKEYPIGMPLENALRILS